MSALSLEKMSGVSSKFRSSGRAWARGKTERRMADGQVLEYVFGDGGFVEVGKM